MSVAMKKPTPRCDNPTRAAIELVSLSSLKRVEGGATPRGATTDESDSAVGVWYETKTLGDFYN
jgi:hypothetical protein